jgi:uncharacterized repeat protein (TIGR01451 family)
VDVLVTTTAAAGTVVAGTGPENLTFTITVKNNGLTDASNLNLDEIFTLPAGVSLSSSTPSTGSFIGTNWSLPTLTAGDTATLTLHFTAAASTANNASATVNATASSPTQALINTGDDVDADSKTIVRQSDLSITKADTPDPVGPGQTLTYTIVVHNDGPSDNTSANIVDNFPVGLSNLNWSADFSEGANGSESGLGNIDATASIPAGGTVTYTVTGTVTAASNTTLTNTVNLTSLEDTNSANNTASASTFVGGVNLYVSKSDGVVTTTPGSHLTYTINYNNAGFQNATGVVLTETLPVGTTFIATGSTVGWAETSPGSGVYTLAIGTLAGTNAGEGGSGTATFIVGVVSAAPAGLSQIGNTVSIGYDNSQGPDTDLSDNTSTDTDTLDAAPDLTITKTNPLVSVPRGYTLNYTINYSNAGNQNATGVVLREHAPAGTTFNSAASSEDWTPAEDGTGDYVLVVGNLGAHATGSTNFAVTVNAFGPDTINNTAKISDDGTNGVEPETEDNSASLSKAVYKGIYAVTPGIPLPKKGALPKVRVFDIATGTELPSITAYEAPYRDSVRIAIADMNGDGFDDVITAKRTGTGSIRVFDGLTGERFTGALSQIDAFNGRTEKGAFVAAGDVNGDGTPDIIAGSALGQRGLMKVFDGRDGSLLAQIRPFGTAFKGGIRVAAGDVDGDGRDEIIAAKGYLGGTVRVYDLVGGGKGGPISLSEQFHFLVGGAKYAAVSPSPWQTSMTMARTTSSPGAIPVGRSSNPSAGSPVCRSAPRSSRLAPSIVAGCAWRPPTSMAMASRTLSPVPGRSWARR